MSRTTLDLASGLIEELKHLAAAGRESMSRLTNRLLRRAVRDEGAAGRQRVPAASWHVVPDGRPAAGFDPASRDYLDRLDEAP